ncbi:MAG: hypothetical protein D8H92_05125, partial [Campylobacter sp.]
VKFQNFAAKIPRRRIFHAFTKYKIRKAYLNNKILKFRNFKNLSALKFIRAARNSTDKFSP